MPYKLKFDDLERLEEYLETIDKKTVGMAKQMVYVGAGEIADAVRASLESVVSDKATGRLANSLDVTKITTASDEVYNKQIFAGYDEESGVAFAKIGAVLESGRSDQPNPPSTQRNKYGHLLKGRKATHFYSRAIRACRLRAQGKMSDKFDEILEKIMKEK